MKFDIDSGKLLYALGVAFAAAALLYFVRDLVFELSITVKAALLLFAAVAFFLGGLAVHRDVLDVVGFALAAVSYVVFVGYVVVRYQPGDTGTFVVLAVSAVLFLALGYLLRERNLTVTRQTAVVGVAALLVVSAVLVGADVLGGGVTYQFEHEQSVTVEAPGDLPPEQRYVEREVEIGTMTATNEFVFTRALSLPPLRGCLVGVDTPRRNDVWLSYAYPSYERPNTIPGGATRQFAVEASLPIDANRTDVVTYDIERGSDCDGDRASPTLLVQIDD